ncbi:MAG: methyltransferase [Microcoleaceae cyanobacterium]
MVRPDEVWKTATLAQNFLEGVRSAIPLAAEQLEMMLRVIQMVRPNVKNFLDLGCGDGVLGQAILQRHPQTRGTFLDFSPTMLEAAQQKVRFADDAASNGAIQFFSGDFGTPNWLDLVQSEMPFDVIVSGFSIHHQPDSRKQELYREIYQLLSPGGVFLNLEHVASQSKLGETLFDQLFVDSLYVYHQRLGNSNSREEIDQQYYNRADKTANILTAVELQCDWLRQIGFQDVDCFMKLFEIALFGGVKPLAI